MNDDDLSGFPPDTPLSSDQLERVIRRAAELQTAREVLPETLEDAEVVQIGAEVGLHESHVRQALLELRAETMAPQAPEEDSLPQRLWGPALIQASRVVPGDRAEVQGRLREYLRLGESLRQVRDRPGLSFWEPASDLISQIRRGLDIGGHGFALARAKRIEVAIQALEPGRSLVTISADLRNQRAEHAGGWYTGAGLTTAGVTAGLVAGAGAPLLLVLPLVAGTAFGGGTWLARRTLRGEREKIELAVQGLLDRLESGGDISAGRSSGLMDRIQGFITEADQ
ncbi:MAG: hypothetical protein R3266_10470 [Gemmatimonadota bacterium]|nr:hypothetical protein [Gemmatimonadota bacterium]